MCAWTLAAAAGLWACDDDAEGGPPDAGRDGGSGGDAASTPDVGPPNDATPDAVPPNDATPDAVPPNDATPDAVPPNDATPDAVPPSDATPDALPPNDATADASPDAGAFCAATSACLDHPAPIRCLGAWRCDPGREVFADHYGADGCNYTCWGALTPCDAATPACPQPGDVCRPCPIADLCPDTGSACTDPDMATVCRNENPAAECAHLPHDDCVGAWTCTGRRCLWVCDQG